MHHLEIFFDKGKTRGTPAVGLDEEGTNGLGKSIRGRITGNGRHDIFNRWEYLEGHSLSHKGPLVWTIHEGSKLRMGVINNQYSKITCKVVKAVLERWEEE